MKSKYFTIQIIPEGANEIKKYRFSTRWFVVLKVFLVVFILVSGFFIFNLAKMNHIIANYEKMKVTNAQLIKKDNNYEEMFSRLDSLWVLEDRIQNIFQTFIENDSNTIKSIIDKNKFAHTPSEKIEINYDGLYHWIPMEEKIKLEHIPSIIPAVGIVSKKFTEEGGHDGTDIAAPAGNPVFAAGSGIVEFAGKKGNLGNTVVIDHKNGYKTSYSHMNTIQTHKNQTVNKGDIIGSVGSTGSTTGPHLHYSITHNGKPEDPETFFNY